MKSIEKPRYSLMEFYNRSTDIHYSVPQNSIACPQNNNLISDVSECLRFIVIVKEETKFDASSALSLIIHFRPKGKSKLEPSSPILKLFSLEKSVELLQYDARKDLKAHRIQFLGSKTDYLANIQGTPHRYKFQDQKMIVTLIDTNGYNIFLLIFNIRVDEQKTDTGDILGTHMTLQLCGYTERSIRDEALLHLSQNNKFFETNELHLSESDSFQSIQIQYSDLFLLSGKIFFVIRIESNKYGHVNSANMVWKRLLCFFHLKGNENHHHRSNFTLRIHPYEPQSKICMLINFGPYSSSLSKQYLPILFMKESTTHHTDLPTCSHCVKPKAPLSSMNAYFVMYAVGISKKGSMICSIIQAKNQYSTKHFLVLWLRRKRALPEVHHDAFSHICFGALQSTHNEVGDIASADLQEEYCMAAILDISSEMHQNDIAIDNESIIPFSNNIGYAACISTTEMVTKRNKNGKGPVYLCAFFVKRLYTVFRTRFVSTISSECAVVHNCEINQFNLFKDIAISKRTKPEIVRKVFFAGPSTAFRLKPDRGKQRNEGFTLQTWKIRTSIVRYARKRFLRSAVASDMGHEEQRTAVKKTTEAHMKIRVVQSEFKPFDFSVAFRELGTLFRGEVQEIARHEKAARRKIKIALEECLRRAMITNETLIATGKLLQLRATYLDGSKPDQEQSSRRDHFPNNVAENTLPNSEAISNDINHLFSSGEQVKQNAAAVRKNLNLLEADESSRRWEIKVRESIEYGYLHGKHKALLTLLRLRS